MATKQLNDIVGSVKAALNMKTARPGERVRSERIYTERMPKAIKDELGYELMRQDGICRVRDGEYACCIKFEDINYQGARYERQTEIHKRLIELVNEFDYDTAFQWFILTRVISKAEFNETMLYEELPEDDALNVYRNEMNAILEDTVAGSTHNVMRDMYIVIRINAANMSKAKAALERISLSVERKLKDLGSEHRQLDGEQWLTLINHITNPDDAEGLISYDDLSTSPDLATLDLVAPPFFEKMPNGFKYGEYYGRVIYLSKYSNTVRDDFVSQIAELPQNMTISLHVQPLDQADSIELVETQLLNLKHEKRNYIMSHPKTAMFDDEMLPGSLGENIIECQRVRDDMVKGAEKSFMLTICIFCFEKTQEDLEHAIEAIKQTARSFTYRFSIASEQIDKFKSCLPVCNCSIEQQRRISSAPLANFVPFASDELYQPGGQYMGYNILSKRHIFYDRKSAIAPNGFIFGMPGRGKSVTVKTQIMQTLMSDPESRVIVLDPEGEYHILCDEVGGQMVKISSNTDNYINPMDISIGYSSNKADELMDPLPLKCDFVISMVRQMAGSITSLEETLVDRVCHTIYQPYLETHDPEKMPILEDLYNGLKKQPEAEAKTLATTIERYVKGSMSLFNNRTNVDMTSRVIVYDVRDLGSNLAPLALLILLDQTWNIITQGRAEATNTWFYVDELQLILDNPQARRYFDTLYSRARKWFAIPTGISQNVSRFLAIEETRLMLQNADFLILLGQSYNDAMALAEILSLSDAQFKQVQDAGVGEGLLIAERKRIAYRYIIPDKVAGKPSKLYKLATTKPKDIAEMMRKGE